MAEENETNEKQNSENLLIDIPDNILNEFRELRTIAPGENGEPSEIAEDARQLLNDFDFKMLTKSGGWIAKMLDGSMRKSGLPGFGDVRAEDFAELAIIAHEELITAKMAKDAPKYAFYSLCLGIITQNGIALKRMRDKQESDQKLESKDES